MGRYGPRSVRISWIIPDGVELLVDWIRVLGRWQAGFRTVITREEVAGPVHRIRLSNTEFEGRNNAYLLVGRDRTALVDTGVATSGTRDQLQSGLAERGLSFADIDDVVLTHWHADHAGLAGEIQSAADATIHVHPDDAPLVRGEPDALAAMRDLQREAFTDWGMPEAKRETLLERLELGEQLAGDPAAVALVEDGDHLSVGDRELTVVHAPGHTAGLCLFAFDGANGREAFVGDALLPVYTPNVGGADVRVERPLQHYLETLEAIEDADYETAWPGHRDPIEDPADRAATIREHHYDRTERVVSVLRDHGPADPWTVSAHLFGDLEGIHIMHGPGEAFAHLDHLEHAGVVTQSDTEYALVPDADERLADLW